MTDHYPFELPQLPYAYNALEPYIDEETMHYHHDKHFKGYIDNLNKALEPYPEYHDWSLKKLLKNIDLLPEDIRLSVKRNGGGVYNHNMYFNSMAPVGTNTMSKEMEAAINYTFGSYDSFKEKMKQSGLSQFGSGWAFLVADSQKGLYIQNMPNQDIPLSDTSWPILPMDVWEHAYYLKYKNERNSYIDNWFNVIDWGNVSKRVLFVKKH